VSSPASSPISSSAPVGSANPSHTFAVRHDVLNLSSIYGLETEFVDCLPTIRKYGRRTV
jgi:hypothetical protein